MRRILLVEPAYRNKYPPLGLMKISAYHKLREDYVHFVKGCHPELLDKQWDRVYVSSLFTFFWRETIRTIQYYGKAVRQPEDVFVGGVLATLLADEVKSETGATIIQGLIKEPGTLDADNRYVVDHLIPDYTILDDIDYSYGIENAYLGYATRGCPNRCDFCAVSRIEPQFVHYCPVKKQVRGIEEVYGTKKDLLLLDNNVLASKQFPDIVSDLLDLGFERGSRLEGKLRRLDFNQGLDARRLSLAKMKLLARTAIHPLRLALDDSRMKDLYVKRVKQARDHGILKFSTYVLFNYTDTPEDFYDRLRTSVVLNEELGTKISSFPMKFIPLDAKDRKYIGPHWNRQLIRGVQCILLATRGMVSPRLEFFEAAFGKTAEEFVKIALMPEPYIIYRRRHEANGAYDWGRLYDRLTDNQREQFLDLVSRKRVTKEDLKGARTKRLKRLLTHYVEPAE